VLKNLKLISFIGGLVWFGLAQAVWAQTASPTPHLSRVQAFKLLQNGGVALVLRHGQTESGVGDPPQFALGHCSTQRNLSESGRSDLRDMAARLSAGSVRFARVYTSQWCRTRETTQLLGQGIAVQDWPVLNSQFADNPKITDANAQISQLVGSIPARQSWLLVTHQVNIGALTGVFPASAEGVLLRVKRGQLEVLGRVTP
jgi:phosphohistidine phosphatase SixA